ncbi:hypothetical protein DFJ58DRAFT_848924 [Suillus subalutaceus]|uniref:uncharacterized protein n=1 Tax=Suillus subalutaceus TaxID=48586 RepID=UPI001B87BD1E|nr:uncharacterized protein DFJ58DRAFT_848924 [Suillus subalutaceus]KAG1828772.1 hypothetical protein DFJ58DRAFT_848924 [Suillus subalutaceus]
MGPGTRRDTLDDHFGNWNWKKTTAFDSQGHTLKCKMEDAVKWEQEHHVALYDLDGTVQPVLLNKWGIEFKMWEEGQHAQILLKASLLAAVRSQLAEVEAQELQAGINHSTQP